MCQGEAAEMWLNLWKDFQKDLVEVSFRGRAETNCLALCVPDSNDDSCALYRLNKVEALDICHLHIHSSL